MKTKSEPGANSASSASSTSSTTASHSAFQTLLERQLQNPGGAVSAAKAEGIAIGQVEHVDASSGAVRVGIPSLGLQGLNAVSMVQLAPQHVGQSVALGFEGGQTDRPVVLGLMMQPVTAVADVAPHATRLTHGHDALQVSHDGRRVVIEAHTELELRCGEAVILLSEDGHIQIRGAYVTSHATASQRIRGGSVQIN